MGWPAGAACVAHYQPAPNGGIRAAGSLPGETRRAALHDWLEGARRGRRPGAGVMRPPPAERTADDIRSLRPPRAPRVPPGAGVDGVPHRHAGAHLRPARCLARPRRQLRGYRPPLRRRRQRARPRRLPAGPRRPRLLGHPHQGRPPQRRSPPRDPRGHHLRPPGQPGPAANGLRRPLPPPPGRPPGAGGRTGGCPQPPPPRRPHSRVRRLQLVARPPGSRERLRGGPRPAGLHRRQPAAQPGGPLGRDLGRMPGCARPGDPRVVPPDRHGAVRLVLAGPRVLFRPLPAGDPAGNPRG
jgi:hypothetical protein